jgi:hypothetical protein
MPKPKSRKKKSPKRVLALPDLEHAKTAVLNSLTSASGQRTYEQAIREFVRLVLLGASSHSTVQSFSVIGSTWNRSSMHLRRSTAVGSGPPVLLTKRPMPGC